MTADRERQVRSTQRRMLRWMLGAGRKPKRSTAGPDTDQHSEGSEEEETEPEMKSEDEELELESWLDWIRRSTEISEEQLQRLGKDDWVKAQRRRKWRLAGHLARRTDGRWSRKAIFWRPHDSYRCPGHPRKRWRDGLESFFRRPEYTELGCWYEAALDQDRWKELEKEFVSQAF
eukprot:7219106-Karenia_brevis.AAC.1